MGSFDYVNSWRDPASFFAGMSAWPVQALALNMILKILDRGPLICGLDIDIQSMWPGSNDIHQTFLLTSERLQV